MLPGGGFGMVACILQEKGESGSLRATQVVCNVAEGCRLKACWAEAHEKIARMTLTIKLDRNWSSFQLANSAPPLSVTDSAIAPSARMKHVGLAWGSSDGLFDNGCFERWFTLGHSCRPKHWLVWLMALFQVRAIVL